MTLSIILLLFALGISSISGQALDPQLLKDGSIAQFWAQYSPYFSAPAEIDAAIPSDCKITFVQVLSRHSARDPAAIKLDQFNTFLDRIRSSVTQYSKDTKFIETYNLDLGADQLTPFGEKEATDSGISFYKRYQALADENDPFIRSVKEDRVVLTANLWKRGVYHSRTTVSDHQTNDHHQQGDGSVPRVHTMSKAKGFNNTLSYGVCTAFMKTWETRGKEAQAQWLKKFTRPIIARLKKKLPGLELTAKDTVLFMQLCPMNTVVHGKESPFCDLFTNEEWKDYKYLETLGKYYAWSLGNPLGSTQGVGFTNELIARLTGQPVNDHTSTNSTLTGDPKTFPLDKKIYADFSQGNIIASILTALGLVQEQEPLSKISRVPAADAAEFATDWLVPFAGRVYVEKMKCDGMDDDEEMVRVLANDRVVPLSGCDADRLGRCKLGRFVESLEFARNGGHWDQCFE